MIPKCIQKILITLEQNGFEAYLVGGFVRDALLGIKTNDFDIATNARPKDIFTIFGAVYGSIKYSSFHLKVKNYTVDITTYRKEIRYEKHLPVELEYTSNLIEDASRRDFTMNAMYMNLRGDLIDPCGYEKDLKAKKVVMIGDPIQRFEEDAIRILRAIRFAVTYDFTMDKEIEDAILKEKKLLKELPREAVQKELDRILLSNGFEMLKKYNLLEELGIHTTNIKYVSDLVGLWAQIERDVCYHSEKNFQKREKNIRKILKYGIIELFDIYEYGYYDCQVAAMILDFPMSKLEEMNKILPIHSRREIVVSPKEIESLSGAHKLSLGILMKDLEREIVLGNVLNEKESIKEYILKR